MNLLDFYILLEFTNAFGIDTLADMEAYLTLTDQTITQLITRLKEEKYA